MAECRYQENNEGSPQPLSTLERSSWNSVQSFSVRLVFRVLDDVIWCSGDRSYDWMFGGASMCSVVGNCVGR